MDHQQSTKAELSYRITQWFHKQKAKYVSILTRGHKNRYIPSKRLSDLSYRHANFVKDQCHKISRSIIDFCVEHQAGTLILGVNPLWKQNSRIGRVNNQKFVSMPIAFLRTMITYKALNAGIKIVEQEESYTSKQISRQRTIFLPMVWMMKMRSFPESASNEGCIVVQMERS